MNNSNPLVSVIIPAFNQEKYIEATITSVLEQTYSNFEIIVVDDSSTDSTFKVVSDLGQADNRVHIYSIPHAGRPSVPRNFGISKAMGEYIAFLDSDDLWVKNKLKFQMDYISKNPLLTFVYSMSVTFGEVSVFAPEYEVLPLLFKAARNYKELLNKGNSITCSSVVVSANLLKQLNGFDEDSRLQIEDYDLWLRLSKLGPFGFIPRIHVYYRVHKIQYSGDSELKRSRLDYLMQKRNITLPEYRFGRNKNIFLLITRNIVHLLTYLWVVLLEKLETNVFKHPLYN